MKNSANRNEQGLIQDLKRISDVMKNLKTAIARMHGKTKRAMFHRTPPQTDLLLEYLHRKFFYIEKLDGDTFYNGIRPFLSG